MLLSRGIRELNLISQDTTRYGHDLPGGADLPGLLRALGKLGGRFRLRLLYGHPAHVTDELLETMGEIPQVCRYLDVPIQHSHPDILRRMRRAGGAEAVHAFPERARRLLPGVTLRTTCLVGFPGETAAHFNDLLAFAGEAEFDHLGVFVFSKEENTAACDLPDPVSPGTAHRRRARLMQQQQGIVFRKAQALKGDLASVMLLRRGRRDEWMARGDGQAPEVDGVTLVRGVRPGAVPGHFVRVRYTGATGYDLRAVGLRG
jgi:ribosomal protein S12 methylthiotransferase